MLALPPNPTNGLANWPRKQANRSTAPGTSLTPMWIALIGRWRRRRRRLRVGCPGGLEVEVKEEKVNNLQSKDFAALVLGPGTLIEYGGK